MPAFYEQGDYAAKVTRQAFGQSDNEKKTAFFALTVQPAARIDMETGDRTDVAKSYDRTIKMFLSEGAAPHTVKKLRALGFDGASFGDLNPDTEDHFSFVGQEVVVRCKHEDYNGSPVEKWDFPQEGGGLENKPLDDKGMRRLDALFGKVLKETKPAAKSDPPRETATAGAGNGAKRKTPF